MRVTVTVDNRIRLPLEELGSELAGVLRADFRHKNPQREMLKRIGKPHWGEPEHIATWSEEGGQLTLPRGGMGRVRKRLEEAGLSRKVVDLRSKGDASGEDLPKHLVKLHPFQEETVAQLLCRECGIIRAPTGSGKSCVALAAASRAKVATLVVVYNVGLFDQWVKRACKEYGLRPEDVGVVRGPKRKLRPFTVAMQQTLSAHGVDQQLRDYFGMVLVDEVHRAAAKTMYQAIDPFPARYRVGISADHKRKDRKEFITEDLFGEVLDDVSRKELIKSGHVLEVQIRVVPTDFRADWYGMPVEKDAEGEQVETGKDVDMVRLHDAMQGDYARNELGLATVCMEAAEGEQVLVFSHRREHCLLLDQRLVSLGVRTGFLIGGDDYRVEFRRTVERIERGDARVGVGTFSAIGQAIDLPTVSVGVCMTPIGSNRQVFNQVRGRFCRTAVGKKGARLYYLWDRYVFGRKHLQNICAWNSDVLVLDEGRTRQDGMWWVPGREYLARLASGRTGAA